MTRTSHKAHPTPSFPVYCLDWADDDTLIMGGGGGATKSGIQNKIQMAKVSTDGRTVKEASKITLSSDEDAPMTLAVDRASKQIVTGINASSSSVQAGTNEQCRLFSYANEQSSIQLQKQVGTITAKWSEDYPYQKITAISPDSSLLAVGTTDNVVSLLTFPSLETVSSPISLTSELVDLAWGGRKGEWLSIATTSSLLLYHVTVTEKGAKLDLKQTIYPPSIDISPVAFRAAKFSPTTPATKPIIHAVLNSSSAPKRGAPRKSFVATFGMVAGPSKAPVTEAEAESKSVDKGKGKEKDATVQGDELGRWDVLVRREVAGKPVTVFDVSADGKLLAFGSADLSIGILDSKTLAPLLKILHAHSFPPTALRFNPSASLLVSASPDNTIRAIVVPTSFDGMSGLLITILISLLVILIALLWP